MVKKGKRRVAVHRNNLVDYQIYKLFSLIVISLLVILNSFRLF